MRSKRLLAFLLVFCLMLGNLAPLASAVEAPETSVLNAEENKEEVANKAESSPKGNSLLASPDAAGNDVPTMRDNPVVKSEIETAENSNGDWQITPAEKPGTSLLTPEVPACVGELKEVAELYAADEVVTAFVVMEGQPLAETHSSPRLVSAAAEKAIIEKQDAVIASIEKTVMKGEKLEVRYQFTYLTNSFSIKTAFANLEQIAYIPGVKSVFVMPMFDPCTTSTPNTSAAGAMTGVHKVWEELDYTGAGMKIAIIDTGLDLDHPSFAADPQLGASSMTAADIDAVLEDLNAYKMKQGITGADLYRSAKIPFAFNYVDRSLRADHSMDGAGDHGSHVAGIAAANALDSTPVVGMAPDAQVIVLKVFGANGGAYADDIVAALEDAMTLGCDVVNASLGSPRGFASSDTELDLIYQRLASQDIVATFSAGNEGPSSNMNTWGTDMNRTQNPDNATIGSPATWVNTLSIASAENCEIHTPYFSIADGSKMHFTGTYQWALGESIGMNALIGQELEYVMIDGLGYAEDYYDAEGNSLVEGKVAVVSRGTLGFGNKIYNAELAGAVAAVIVNNNDEIIYDFYMNVVVTDDDGNEILPYPNIPACMIVKEDGEKMAAAEVKTMVVSKDTAPRAVEGGQMSSFSSWGVSPDLQLVPDITGIGGNVYSTVDGGNYGVMSGTSMSAPQIAGVTALVMQRLYELYPNAPDGTIRELAEAMLMSTANPIIGADSGVETSPRQQGAGLVDAYKATTTEVYLTVGGGRPKAELGDNSNGVFKFSFEIHNIGSEDKTYTLDASLLTEAIAGAYGEYFMYGMDMPLSGDVTFDKDTVTVPAGGKANVKATVTLSDEDKALFAAAWENGGYVEGYVYLFNEEGASELSLPFLGFYGDWTQAPIFDTAYWYDNSFWGVPYATGLPEGDEYYNVMWTDLGGQNWVLGMNPYSGAAMGADGKIVYDPANNVVSPNGDHVLDGITEIYLSLLRNAKTLTFTYTVDGEVMHEEVFLNNGKTMYISAYGQVVPWIYSWYGMDLYDFTDAQGNVLPSGTEVLLTIDATIDYGTGGEHSIQIPITVDNTKPELTQVLEQAAEDESQHLMGFVVSDNVSLASVVLMSASGTTVYDQVFDYHLQDLGDGYKLAVFDITDLGTEFTIAVCDYACNESYYKVEYTLASDGNLPEMDTTQLYAYRVLDDHIMSDHMYGWVSMNKPASAEEYANISVWSDDYMEYAAINAAEFVGGKIFAVDAVYNLVVMDPGLWSRQQVCNLGVNVIDMTFDDSTDTMYVLSKQGYYTYLYTMDLLTGELTRLINYGYYYYAPWAIADDDNGTLYATKYNSANIFTLDVAGKTKTMTPVTDADGANLVITTADGAAVTPSAYAQSITWIDGTLYWAYLYSPYYWSYTTELICINTTDWSFFSVPYAAQGMDASGAVVDYNPAVELVGLLSLEPTDYVIPESTAATKLILDQESAILRQGESLQLSVSALPWNYDLTDVTWTSSDETIATVDETGFVSTVAPGTVTITATHGDLTAQCVINVVKIEGSFNAYNYYSGDGYEGYMIQVDLETMDYYIADQKSPVDFISGDYNGHDGYFYGYKEGGQLYRYDMSTHEAVALGAPISGTPVDMAYDYSTGLMYMITLDFNTYENKLYTVNMNNGKVHEEAVGQGLLTLAVDTEGNLFGGDLSGYLNQLFIQDYSAYGMGMVIEAMPVIEEPLGEVYMLQSMCYDHNYDVFLWACCDAVSVYWIDIKGETPVVVSLGDPTESGVFEFVGLHVVPNEIPELADTAVSTFETDDMLIFTGYEKAPAVNVMPFNATCQNVTLVSGDESVVSVTESGNLLGVAPGTATITATLKDTVGGQDYSAEFTVTVMDAADNMKAHLLTDISTMNGQLWIEMFPSDPSVYEMLGYMDYTIFTAEYYDGKIYTYGYDAYDWTANWQFFVLDAETYEIEKQIDMGEAFPYVYDMTYDYATSTMYLLAGAAEDDTNLYVASMETGEAVLLMETDPLFMGIAAAPGGKLYVTEQSKAIRDEWDPWGPVTYTNANLHVIDPLAGTVELIGDTGILSNMIGSMAYDYDTDTLYWVSFAQTNAYVSNLSVINTETGAATSLGAVGAAGAQVGGLYFQCDEFPAENKNVLHKLLMTTPKASLIVGQTTQLNALTIPAGVPADITWTSGDESVATVDENGVVTGVKQGKVTITAAATLNGTTMTATATVAVLAEDAAFLSYNVTDKCWTNISRADTTVATNEGEPADYPEVITFTVKDETVYGYDVNNQLFSMDPSTLVRTNIGDDLGITVEEGSLFDIRDMAYDAANDRVLVLASTLLFDDYYGEYDEIYGGTGFYSVDLTTGELTLVHTIGEEVRVFALTVDKAGNAYYYSVFDDAVTKLNMATGETSTLVNLQSQSLYGDMECDYALYFDELTDTLYLLFTSNGRFYKMHTIDAKTGTLIQGDYVGEIIEEDQGGWSVYYGDDFNGLSFLTVTGHTYETVVTAPTCTEKGYTTFTCVDEGCDHSYVGRYVDALGHSGGKVQFSWNIIDCTASAYQICETCGEKITHETTVTSEVKAPSCTEGGSTIYTASCVVDGETYESTYVVVSGDAVGHTYESVVTDPTCDEQGYTTHTCTICGHSYVDSYVDALGIAAPEITVGNILSNGANKIMWNAVDGAASYNVYYSLDGETWEVVKEFKGTSLKHVSAAVGTKYYYYVTAVSAGGTESEMSNVVAKVRKLARPVVTVSNIASTGAIKLSWEPVPGALKYAVYVSTDKENWELVKEFKGTSLKHVSAAEGTRYYYKVMAVSRNPEANSAFSKVVSRLRDLASPELKVTLNSKNKPCLTWSQVAGAVKYQVLYSTDGETWTRVYTTGTKLTHSSAVAGTTYFYKVRAIAENSYASSAYCEVVTVTAG